MRVRDALFLVAGIAVVFGAVVATGAVTGTDASVQGLSLSPSPTTNGQAYASIDGDGELTIEATELNPEATTRIDDVFTVSATDDPAKVWIEHTSNDRVTFYRMDTRGSIENSTDGVDLQPGQTVAVGILIESASSSRILDEITVRAEVDDESTSSGGGPAVDVEEPLRVVVETDGDEQTVTIENAREGQPVTAGLNETSSMRASGVYLRSIDLALSCAGDAQLRVIARQSPTRETPTGAMPLFAYAVESSGDCGVGSATTHLAVDRGLVDAGDRDPTSVTSLRMPTGESAWEETATTLVETTDDHYVYRTATNGFSEFALVANVPVFRTETLTANRTTVRAGEPVRIDGTVRNVGRTNGSEPVDIRVDGDVVASRDAALEPNESVSMSTVHRLGTPGDHTIAIGDREVTVTVVDQTATTTDVPTETGPTETTTSTPDQSFQIGGLSLGALLAIAVTLGALLAGLVLFRRYRNRAGRE